MSIMTGNVLKGDVDVTLFGNPTLVDGVRGKALSFNGVDQYAEINDHTYVLNVGIVLLSICVGIIIRILLQY